MRPSADLAAALLAAWRAGAAGSVVLYGTSLTHSGAWAGALTEWFQRSFGGRVAVHNRARCGETSTWGLNALAEEVFPCEPDLVFVEFSYNDAHVKFDLTPEKSVSQLDAMVRALSDRRPGCVIVVQLMNFPWDSPGRHAAATERPEFEIFNAAWRDYAVRSGLVLIDHGPVWARLREDPTAYARAIPDGSHPNAQASLAHTWPTVLAWLESAMTAASARVGA